MNTNTSINCCRAHSFDDLSARADMRTDVDAHINQGFNDIWINQYPNSAWSQTQAHAQPPEQAQVQNGTQQAQRGSSENVFCCGGNEDWFSLSHPRDAAMNRNMVDDDIGADMDLGLGIELEMDNKMSDKESKSLKELFDAHRGPGSVLPDGQRQGAVTLNATMASATSPATTATENDAVTNDNSRQLGAINETSNGVGNGAASAGLQQTEKSGNGRTFAFSTKLFNLNKNKNKSDATEPEKILTGDQLLAKDMQQLSMDEREDVYNDIHGVATMHDEDPAFIRDTMERLHRALHRKKNAIYEKAVFLNPAYVKGTKFCLMFLRCGEFNIPNTVSRIIQHFELKAEMFGVDTLGRRIVWDDLDEGTKSICNNGSLQMFSSSCRDRSGRGLFYTIYSYRNDHVHDDETEHPDDGIDGDAHAMDEGDAAKVDNHGGSSNPNGGAKSKQSTNGGKNAVKRDPRHRKEWNYAKAFWYTVMMGVQDDELTQRKGGVGVLYVVGVSITDFSRALLAESKKMVVTGLPIRPSGAHICFGDLRLRQVFAMLLKATPKQVRLHMRLHVGSHLECQYALNAYGITDDMLPFDQNGNLKESDFRKRLDDAIDAEKQVTEPGVCAQEKDILLGRGIPYRQHPGNSHLLRVVESFQTIHANASTRAVKTNLFQDIVDILRGQGSKFLKRVDVGGPNERWEEVNDKLARERVAMCFRNRSRKDKAAAT